MSQSPSQQTPSPTGLRLQPTDANADEPGASAEKDPELYWLKHVYQGGSRQLTVRAVIAGMLIGAVMCLSNLYVILKTGWSLGVTITACILAFAVFSTLRSLRVLKNDFTDLENNAMGSVASAAGYMTGGGNMAAVPALLMLTGTLPPAGWLVVWFAVISALGVFAAIPIKRQLINIEALPFPTGTATAETIRALHGHGEVARRKSRLLTGAGVVGALLVLVRDARFPWLTNIPEKVSLPFTMLGKKASAWTMSLDFSLLLVGAGALVSFRTGWSMFLGAVLSYGFLAPAMVTQGSIPEITYKAINSWMVWTGSALLVSSGLLAFAFQWRSVARSFKALSGLFRGKGAQQEETDPLAGIECPPSWFPLGFAVLGPIAIFLMAYLFQIPWWAGVLAMPLAVVMGVVASRVTGETDTTPTKALGPVTQLIFGGLAPGNIPANVMSANATGGVGLHSADLLTDLKSGWLLGANPRQQFVAQLFGVVAGAAVVVPVFNLLIPNAEALGTEEFPAPATMVWAGVSKLLATGVSAMPVTARWGALCGATLGICLVLLERWAPAKLKGYIPSPAGFGLAIVIPASSSIAFFLGSAIAEVLRRKKPKLAEDMVLPVSSGFIAGESLLGIAIAMAKAFGVMPK
ncbi:OPT/YSL family transporter [Myxococcus sp. MISCRS1]|uniref:OPT family oligopeptide transporter n=1 Tax=Myxococcus TaxID=32 RepID=UPI001CBAEA80|nr:MULTISPECIES: OPT family oligopeptide transporter [unclassified Myxococcus]MBZ4397087.1 OPT/YSL family transporter [Myxococcus sp. AS-1-15]MCY0996700.1 OPT/YSL family transporter [Myxococcus sp. MISCRS1]BDT33285.1 OPT/YSL family transporter [Myxococcus sp. MH1]